MAFSPIRFSFHAFALCLAIIPIFATGQQTYSDKTVVPPAIATSEFTKNINNGVTYQTGQVNSSIQLFALPVDEMLQIPVELSYSGGGVKYKQFSGEVGLGWNVSPNYRISRTIYCRPDEHYPRISSSTIDSYTQETNYFQRDKYLTQLTYGLPSNQGMWLYPGMQLLDSEYDIFDYSTPNLAGSFVLEDVQNRQIATPDNARIKVDYMIDANIGITKMELTDTKGMKMVAGMDEPTGQLLWERGASYNGKEASNAWPVTKIVTPNNNAATFKYTFRSVTEYSPEQNTMVIDEIPDPLRTFETSINTNLAGSAGHSKSYFVDEVRAKSGYVKYYRQNSNNFIDSICLYDNTNVRVKKAAFHYSNKDAYLFLDSVVVTGLDNSARMSFKFEYVGKAGSGVYALMPDIWGNLTTRAPNINIKGFHEEFENEYYYRRSEGDPDAVVFDYLGGLINQSVDRTPQIDRVDMYSLSKITLPTGGSMEFEYEPNWIGSGTYLKQGPGVRLKKKVTYDPVAQQSTTSTYEYGINGDGGGSIYIDLEWYHFCEDRVNLYVENNALYPYYYFGRSRIYSNDPVTDNDPFFTKYNVVNYPEVKEYSDGGATKYYYINRSLVVWNSGFPLNYGFHSRLVNSYMSREHTAGYVHQYNLWDRPILQKKEIIDASNNVKVREEFEYEIQNDKNLRGLKVRPFASFAQGYMDGISQYNGLESVYDFGDYFITTGNQLLKKKTVTQFEGAQQISAVTDYRYNSAQQVEEEKLVVSDGSIKRTLYKYPNSFQSLTDADVLTQDIKKMDDANMVDEWVETKTTTENPGDAQYRVTGASIKAAMLGSGNIRSVFTLKNSSPVTGFADANVAAGKVNIDPGYTKDFEATGLDGYGNIQSVTGKAGQIKSYIWGYNGAYLIATVENAAPSDIAYSSFENTEGFGQWINQGVVFVSGGITGSRSANFSGSARISSGSINPATRYKVTYWTKRATPFDVSGTIGGTPVKLATAGDWSLYEHTVTGVGNIVFSGDGIIDEVRLHPATASMESYTYRPLIGVVSKSGVNGTLNFFEYDANGRLRVVKDQMGRVTQLADYKYATEQ